MGVTAILNTLFVSSDGAEEEKMETETDGQQSEKVSLAEYAGSEKIVLMLTNRNYYVLKCRVRKTVVCWSVCLPTGNSFRSS